MASSFFPVPKIPSNKQKKAIHTPRKIKRWITWEYTFTPLKEEKSSEPNHHFQPGTCLSSIFSLYPSKIRSFPIKTVVIWVRFGGSIRSSSRGCENSIVFCWISQVFRVRRFHLKEVMITFWFGEDGCLSNKGSKGCLFIPALHPRNLTWIPFLKGVYLFQSPSFWVSSR